MDRESFWWESQEVFDENPESILRKIFEKGFWREYCKDSNENLDQYSAENHATGFCREMKKCFTENRRAWFYKKNPEHIFAENFKHDFSNNP